MDVLSLITSVRFVLCGKMHVLSLITSVRFVLCDWNVHGSFLHTVVNLHYLNTLSFYGQP